MSAPGLSPVSKEGGMAQTRSSSPSRTGGLDRFFRITERGSTVRTEIVAGLATYLTMAYILFVNPQVLGLEGEGLPFDQVLAVTALTAGVMTLAMGLVANYPFAIAAGLGLNAFVAFGLVLGFGLSFPEAMGVIVIEGLVITLLVLTGFREAVVNAIPMDLKRAIGIGIGLFIAFIGLENAGIVVHPEAGEPILTLNPDLTSLRILIFVIGFVLTAGLVARRVRGALLIGIIATTVIGVVINEFWGDAQLWGELPGVGVFPSSIVSAPDLSLIGDFSFGFFDTVGVATAIALILSVMLSDFFDTVGTVIGVGGEAKLLDASGRLPRVNRVLLVDSLAAAAGGATSSSSNTTYIESAAGVSEGGRTGLTAVVVGVLFLLSLFLSPLAGVIPAEATAPVLILVGYFMMTIVRDIDWGDPGVGIPALLTMALMPFTFSITNGVGAGFLAYTVIAVLRGRFRDVHPLMYLVSAVFVWYFVRGLLG
jgi:AGZA family xanthine/uracil permease-like MFS transporter